MTPVGLRDLIRSARPRAHQPLTHVVANSSAVVAAAILIAATGGEDSPFEFLYVLVLAHAAVVCGRSWVLVAGSLMAAFSAGPLLLDRATVPIGSVLGDVADVVVWTAIAVFVTLMRDRLRRNEERYRSLFEKHPDPVSSRDRWGHIEHMNAAASSLVGMDPDELADRDWTDFVPPERLEEIQSHFVLALKGQPCSFETQLLHAEGHRIDVAITFIPVVVEREVIGVHHITQDISERVRAQSALALFQRVVDQISDGVLIWGPGDGSATYVNPAAANIFDVPRDEVRRRSLGHLAQDWDPLRLQAVLDERAGPGDEGVRVEFDIGRPDGTVVPVESVAQKVTAPDGGSVYVAVLRDMSAHRDIQEALKSALDAQEASTQRLWSVNEMQKTFLQAVSHELRTPLTSITGYAQTLQGHWGDLPADKVAHILERLAFNSHRLSDMLQDLLDVDRLSRGTIQLALTETNLGDLCRQVVDQIELRGRPVRVRSDVDVVASIDRPKVERIVENLVYNATKHTPDATTIVVRIEAQSDGAVITVEDDGPGVPAELRETIFEPFRQGPQSASSASPGTGIGLALVSQFSSLHGGRAWVDEAPDGGAAFRVFLPYEPSREVIEEQGSSPEEAEHL